MREIKFRGKTLDGKWIYGAYLPAMDDDSCDSIINSDYPCGRIVKTTTVGQYTTKCDRMQCKVYEDDIVRDELGSIGVVIFMEGMFAVDFGEGIELQELNTGILEVCEIIGNIHDNPELLK